MYEFLTLLNQGPLVVPIYATYIVNYKDGIIDNDSFTVCPENAIPNHAVIAIGYHIDI